MKTKLCIIIFLLAAALAHAQTNNLTALLQQGLFEEQANRNLNAAIADYQALARQFDKDRQLAATAVFRLGECYRMQGKTNEAALEYQRILRDFSDQTTLATLSQQNLAGMGVQLAPAVSEARQQQRDLLAKQIALAEQDLVETQKLVQVGTAPLADSRAAEREVLRLKQQLAALDAGRVELLDLSVPASSEEDQEIRRIQQMIQNSPDLINAPGEGGNTPLTRAANADWLKVATFLLDHGADVNMRARDGNSPVITAAIAGNRAMVELLLSRGANVNAKGDAGYTALQQAARRGFQAVAEALLASHADVNVLDNGGATALCSAASSGQFKIVQMLLGAGASPNLKDGNGRTVLNFAIGTSPEIFQVLLEAGTNPNTEDSDGRTPLSYAVERDNPKVVKLLLTAKADSNGGKLDAPLLCAIGRNDAASAELLLQAGAKPNAIGNIDLSRQPGFSGGSSGGFVGRSGGSFNGGPVGGRSGGRGGRGGFAGSSRSVTPLWLAISENQLSMVQLLLKYKADPNGSQPDGSPLIFYALPHLDILAALLDAGADPNQPDRYVLNNPGWQGESPLMSAVGSSFYETAEGNLAASKLLIAHGANTNFKNKVGNTALHYAVNVGNRELVRLLLDNKADPNAENNDGITPLANARANENITPAPPLGSATGKDIAVLLRQHGALDNLPEWDRITVSRPSAKYSAVVFYKGTNDWNRFTSLDAILNCYQSPHSFSGGTITPTGMSQIMQFPDLARVTILRHTHGTTNETRIPVNLLNSTNGVDCSKDVPLEFGDVVEIPERNHALGDQPVGLSASEAKSITDYLKGSVLLVAHGQKVELSIYPSATGSELGSVVRQKEAQKVLLSSSDLSRVKVIRRDAKTGKTEMWILDCSDRNNQGTPDLWLRGGDVIDVPAK